MLDVTPLTIQMPAAGGRPEVKVTVTQGSNCAWTALPVGMFLAVSGTYDRTGSGIVTLIVSENFGPARSGTAIIAGKTVTVNQDAVAPTTCVFVVSPTRVSLPLEGGTATFTVTVTQGTSCAWTTTIAGTGITILSGASGIGSGTVVVSVAPNPGTERTNGIIIAGQLVTLNQPARPGACAFDVSPRTFALSAAAQNIEFDVRVTTGDRSYCSWSLSTPDPSRLRMVSMTPDASGNTTRVVLAAAENTTTAPRTLFASAAEISLSITQAGKAGLAQADR